MYDFKSGDLVQVDPALIAGKARVSKGVGVVERTANGGTITFVKWPDKFIALHERTCDLVPVGGGS